jgi:sulfur carrier protein
VILVNGESSEVPAGTSVAELLRVLGAPDRGVAVAIDGEVVPRARWDDVPLTEGARVEVVQAVQGG